MITRLTPKFLIGDHGPHRILLWSKNLDRLNEHSISINFNSGISYYDSTRDSYDDCNMQLNPWIAEGLIRAGIQYSTYVVHSHFVAMAVYPKNTIWYYSEVHNVLQLTCEHDINFMELMFF